MKFLARPSLLLFLVVTACGGDGSDLPDAGTSLTDAPHDADRGTARVTVQTDWICCATPGSGGQPVGGIEVVALDPGGDYRVVTTGADGRATLEVFPGTSITAIYRIGERETTLLTFTDVVDGDVLRFGDPDPGLPFATTETMWVDYPPVEGASGYHVVSSCSTAYADPLDDHGEVRHSAVCNPASEDLYLYACVDGVLAFHAEIADVAFVDGGTVTAASWTPARPFVLGVSGLPEGSSVLLGLSAFGNNDVIRFDHREGAATDGSFAAMIPWTSSADSMTANIAVSLPARAIHHRSEPFDARSTSHTFDEVITLPTVSDVELDHGDETVRYTLDGVAAYDTTVARLHYTRQDGAQVEWRVYGPPSGSSGRHELVLPDLPPAYDDLALRTAKDGIVTVSLVELDSIAGFDAFRELPMFDAEGVGARQGSRSSEGY